MSWTQLKTLAITGLSNPDVIYQDGTDYARVRVMIGKYPTCQHCSAKMMEHGVLPSQVARGYAVACDADGNFTDMPVETHVVIHPTLGASAIDWSAEIDGIRQQALADLVARKTASMADAEIPLAAQPAAAASATVAGAAPSN